MLQTALDEYQDVAAYMQNLADSQVKLSADLQAAGHPELVDVLHDRFAYVYAIAFWQVAAFSQLWPVLAALLQAMRDDDARIFNAAYRETERRWE
jgi:hypothetical protein